MDAHLKADSEALAELLREDARLTMPPIPSWYEGARRDHDRPTTGLGPSSGSFRSRGTSANTLPAAAHHLRRPAGRSTGRSPSMCCGSRVDGSPRSPRSSIQNCSRLDLPPKL